MKKIIIFGGNGFIGKHVTSLLLMDKNLEIHVDERDFKFYVKSEFDQLSNRNQIDNNESNADKLVLDIIGKSIN